MKGLTSIFNVSTNCCPAIFLIVTFYLVVILKNSEELSKLQVCAWFQQNLQLICYLGYVLFVEVSRC